MSVTHTRVGSSTGLLERLMEVVRPEFRGEVYLPSRESSVFYSGVCRIPSCVVALSQPIKRLCGGHYDKWTRAGKPSGSAMDAWVTVEDVRTRERIRRLTQIEACAVRGCNRSAKAWTVCHRHGRAFEAHYRPRGRTITEFLAEVTYLPPAGGERDCRFPDCGRWAEGLTNGLCRKHEARWRARRKPDLDDWLTELSRGGDPRISFAGLSRQLTLEAQFGLQCRHDEAKKRTPPRVVTSALSYLKRASVHSLLDYDEQQWRAHVGTCVVNPTNEGGLAFLLDTRLRLHSLLVSDDPWADQYPRDRWDLFIVNIRTPQTRYLHFEGIPQAWLKTATKRWARGRLSRGVSSAQVKINIQSVAVFAAWLPATGPASQVTRDRIEDWLAALNAVQPSDYSRARTIRSVGMFLRDAHRHGWLPDLPRSAVIADDTPRRLRPAPRFIPEFVMRQLEHPDNVAKFDRDDGRVLLQILIACGLRLKDARWLPLDCVSRDNDGAPYLLWINRKMRRHAYFPISQALAGEIAAQQERVRRRFPQGSPWLFPAHQANLDGSTALSDSYWREHSRRWLQRLNLTDEAGNPVRVTAHQFRHTLGTRLINANVPQHVVQQLLDHMSPEMTAVYARIHNKTVRRHWESAVKVNADGQAVTIDQDHPLADASWSRLSMVRAKVTLPNGYCGAPIQTDCEYANPCLDCQFFITTADFLDQHRRHRTETAALISDAEASGLARVAEKNRRTLGRLDTIIDVLETATNDQIVAGGRLEDLDAAG
ncbi:tyrosine-type recombinase/integrase [Krasilnikovia sp. MM14-A1259]|uniref:tyrosine-type recombinase/integrase n=1 Tax=Krasilnikovia sp. MM14-A1259 TaxID=3373539 RepID=UPI003812410C